LKQTVSLTAFIEKLKKYADGYGLFKSTMVYGNVQKESGGYKRLVVVEVGIRYKSEKRNVLDVMRNVSLTMYVKIKQY